MAQEILKILLVEHDTAFARYVSEMFQQTRDLACEVRSVPDLAGGLCALLEEVYDVVLLDLCVPDGAGLANIFLIQFEAPRLPILMVGDSDDQIVALEAVQAGAQEYLVKSQITPGWLERSVRYAIERNRLDIALLAAEKRYHHLFDSLIEGIFQTTPEGRYLLANAALARIYGYGSPEELMQSLTNIGEGLYVQKERRGEFIRLMQERDTITGFESQVYRKDGSVIWISENCRAIRDSQGALLYYEGTVEDITQRKQVEEELKKSEALYHSLVETLPQNIFRKDLEGRFTFANQQFCRTLKLRLEEIIGKTDFDFFPRELAEKYQRDDRHVIRTGKLYDDVEEHRPPGGEKMYVQVVKTPLPGVDNQPIGLQGIFWDITQQRLAEEKIKRANALLAQSRKELRIRNLEMEDDLKMAREIQQTMLPQQYPVFPRSPGSSESAFQFTHRYLPTGTVGGDFFTVSALSDTEAAVFICDVAGHGVRSSLITAMIRALVEELKPVASDPGRFLSKLNSDLYAILKHTGTPMLTTAFYLVVDSRTGVLRFGNAGHPRPVLISRAKGLAQPLANSPARNQPALGLFEDAVYGTSTVQLQPRDLVMLFTDGLYEVQDPKGELYTQGLLMEQIQSHLQIAAPQLFDNILEEIQRFASGTGFTDDVCLVGMEYADAFSEAAR